MGYELVTNTEFLGFNRQVSLVYLLELPRPTKKTEGLVLQSPVH